jgi:starvation-inducible DNA-binding protein
MPPYTVPGLDPAAAERACTILQDRLVALTDLHLTLKHIHWNVVGPSFIGVHKMLDPQVELARAQADEVAERIATLGGEPVGTPGAVVQQRSWDDYKLKRATVPDHLSELDRVFVGLIEDHRKAFAELEAIDQVSSDLLVQHTQALEQEHWFVRAHLEDRTGRIG